MLITPATYEPKAVFSPSGLSRHARCAHSWGLRYLLGIKREEWDWPTALAAVKPEPLKKNKPTAEERAELKAYNSLYRPALGKECHARLETYFKGGSVDWNDKPGRIVLAGMHLLPHPDECEVVEAEGEITIEVDGVRLRGYRDLLVKKDGQWILIDHKTTLTFDYFDREKTQRTVKTPEQLIADTQANLYAFEIMRREKLSSLACRWVYYRTEDSPAATAVDFTILRGNAERIVAELVEEAKRLTEIVESARDTSTTGDGVLNHVRLRVVQVCHVDELAQNPDACGDFGGCEYHSDRGGPCSPPALTAGERMKQLAAKQKIKAALPPKPARPAERKRPTMGFRDKMKEKKQDEAASEPETDAGEGQDVVDETPAAEAAPPATTAAAPAPKRKTGPRKVDTTDGPDISITSESGASLVLPKSSPLYAQASAVFSALFPEG